MGPGNSQQDHTVETEVDWQELGRGADAQLRDLGVGQVQSWHGMGVRSGEREAEVPFVDWDRHL